ncbi:hypothetical protein SOPP22_18060 [Shewanella sp. OPT22]|nr:hypothetical protein SOPP22_18060 [Shewanella sp. OPT22]
MATATSGAQQFNAQFSTGSQQELSQLEKMDLFSKETKREHKQGLMCRLHTDINKAQERSLNGTASVKLTQKMVTALPGNYT